MRTIYTTDLRNVSLPLYRERRKHLPTLPKRREDTHAAIEMIDTMTSKNEKFLIAVNDQESGIIIFSTETNVTCLCNDVEELFIDGTFKCCARHFYQLHTIHGGKKGKYHVLYVSLGPDRNCPRTNNGPEIFMGISMHSFMQDIPTFSFFLTC